MDKTTILRAFNNHFFEFVDDMITIFPDNDDLQSSRKSFDIIKRANPSTIIKAWFLYVFSPYRDIIEKGDISFFFEKDYSNDLCHLKNPQTIMNIIDSLREPVRQMSDLNKEHSIKYIQNLSKLSELYTL